LSNSAFTGALRAAALPWPSAVVASFGGPCVPVGLADGVAVALGDGLAELPRFGDAEARGTGSAASCRDRAVRLWPPEPDPAGPSAAPDGLADALGDGLGFADALADGLGEAEGVGAGTGTAEA